MQIIETDGLTDSLCTDCFQKLCTAHDLIQTCVTSDTILRNVAKDECEESVILETNCDSNEGDHVDSLKCEENADEHDEQSISTSKCVKYTCSICHVSFNNKAKFTKHRKIHNDNNPFKCHECSQTFPKKLHLNVHLRSHIKNEDKKFSCGSCNKQFMYEYLLKQHEYKHTDEKPYPCKFCTKGK